MFLCLYERVFECVSSRVFHCASKRYSNYPIFLFCLGDLRAFWTFQPLPRLHPHVARAFPDPQANRTSGNVTFQEVILIKTRLSLVPLYYLRRMRLKKCHCGTAGPRPSSCCSRPQALVLLQQAPGGEVKPWLPWSQCQHMASFPVQDAELAKSSV